MPRRKVKLNKFAKELGVELAPCVDAVYKIYPRDIIFDILVRKKCMTCGAYKRKKTCSPYSPSIKHMKALFRKKVGHCYLIIMRNDGTRAWWIEKDEQRNITLAKHTDRALKGVNVGMQLYCHRLLKCILERNKWKIAMVLAAGPCHKCDNCLEATCKEPPPLYSMEGVGIAVYDMLDKLEIPYENPVRSELLAVSLVAFKKEDKNVVKEEGGEA